MSIHEYVDGKQNLFRMNGMWETTSQWSGNTAYKRKIRIRFFFIFSTIIVTYISKYNVVINKIKSCIWFASISNIPFMFFFSCFFVYEIFFLNWFFTLFKASEDLHEQNIKCRNFRTKKKTKWKKIKNDENNL